MMLGDLGADIIKVEHFNGDDTRQWGPPFVGTESAYFLSVNRNKRSIKLDLKTKKGYEIILDLVKKSHVLIENFLPGKLQSYGLGYKECAEINPGLVYASITGYGQTGPYSTYPGYDATIE